MKNKLKNEEIDIVKPKGIIFDFNGVMIDDFPLQREVWNQISLELRDKEVTDEEMVQNIRGVPTVNTIKWFGGKKLTSEEIEVFAKKKDKLIEELYQTSPLFKLTQGLEDYLNHLKEKNIPMTIATSSREGIFHFSFERLALSKWFDEKKILYNDGTHKGKPDPEPYIIAAKKIGLAPEQCVIIEDAKSGLQSAYAAGCKNIVLIGNDERISILGKMPGVKKTINVFSEIKVEDFFN